MATLTVTSRGQVTFRREILNHLGIKPGDRIELDLLPNGQAALKAERPATARIEDLFGCLAGKTTKVATLEEIEQAISDGWAGKL